MGQVCLAFEPFGQKVREPNIDSIELVSFLNESREILSVLLLITVHSLLFEEFHEKVASSVLSVRDMEKRFVCVVRDESIITGVEIDTKPGPIGL